MAEMRWMDVRHRNRRGRVDLWALESLHFVGAWGWWSVDDAWDCGCCHRLRHCPLSSLAISADFRISIGACCSSGEFEDEENQGISTLINLLNFSSDTFTSWT